MSFQENTLFPTFCPLDLKYSQNSYDPMELIHETRRDSLTEKDIRELCLFKEDEQGKLVLRDINPDFRGYIPDNEEVHNSMIEYLRFREIFEEKSIEYLQFSETLEESKKVHEQLRSDLREFRKTKKEIESWEGDNRLNIQDIENTIQRISNNCMEVGRKNISDEKTMKDEMERIRTQYIDAKESYEICLLCLSLNHI